LAENGKSEPAADGGQLTFEQMLEKLEAIIEQLEEGQLGLGDALLRYEEGVKHLKQCYQVLEKAERKIELLAGVDAEGNPIREPFEEEAMSLDEKKESRSRRRSRPNAAKDPKSSGDDGVDTQGGLF
jgi:exodeoxyribonuclease VII small subunit